MLHRRLKNWILFRVERLVLAGTASRLLIFAVLIALTALIGGLLAMWATGSIEHPGDAVWWAFLRLSDPGYLGDDEGDVLRVISTILTVLGYVLVMGVLVAIMVQWVNDTVERLATGLTPISARNHILILGWSSRTPVIIHELLASESRIRRFLDRRRGGRRVHIVILTEKVGAHLVQELRDELGSFPARKITFRQGSPLRLEHLQRADFLRAAAILVPAHLRPGDFTTAPDSRSLKVLLSIGQAAHSSGVAAADRPLVVAEFMDARQSDIARTAYRGPLESIPSDRFVSHLMVQALRHPGLSHVIGELLSNARGNSIYLRSFPALAGVPFHQLASRFRNAVAIGIVSADDGLNLVPSVDRMLYADDRVVLIAGSYEDAAPHTPPSLPPAPNMIEKSVPWAPRPASSILIMGWNSKAPALLREFDSLGQELRIDVLSLRPVHEREAMIKAFDASPAHLQLRNLEGDYTIRSTLAPLQPERYQHVLILASDRLESGEESDARSVLGYLVLQNVIGDRGNMPHIVIELLDEENVALFHKNDEVLVSPLVLSHILTQVSLRRGLFQVFSELFGPGGGEIFLHDSRRYEGINRECSFGEIQDAALRLGEIAIGIELAGRTILNPGRDTRFHLGPNDRLIIVATW